MPYPCPICGRPCAGVHQLRTHLHGNPPGHNKSDKELEDLVAGVVPNTVEPKAANPGAVLTPGHEKCLKMIEDTEKYRTTLQLYRGQGVPVYLRPTDDGFTVLSLDYNRCSSMIGVGANNTKEHKLTRLPPSQEEVRRAVEGYLAKAASLGRSSGEEQYALRLIAGAFEGNLSLSCGQEGIFFINQEWRFKISGQEVRIDILAVDPAKGRFCVIELKDSEAEARKYNSKKGGNAWAQAAAYSNLLYSNRAEFYPYFERFAKALASGHNAPEALKNFKITDPWPVTMVLWPPQTA